MSSLQRHLADFGPFTFNFSEHTLQRSNRPLDLPGRPAAILGYLIENRGRWVSRDELAKQVWHQQFVENNTIDRQISEARRALGDSPDKPRFIETKYKYGWRFIASVSERTEIEPVPMPPKQTDGSPDRVPGSRSVELGQPSVAKSRDAARRSASATGSAKESAGPESGTGDTPGNGYLAADRTQAQSVPGFYSALLAIAFVIAIASLTFWLGSKPQPRVLNSMQLTNDGRRKTGPLLTDGQRIFFVEYIEGNGKAFNVPISGGEPVPLNIPIPNVTLQDISRDGTTLLVRSYDPYGRGLWTYSLSQHILRPVQSGLTFAAWARDGATLAAATDDQSAIQILKQHIAKRIEVPGKVGVMRWSPDSQELRFSLLDRKEQSSSEWEITQANLRLRRLSVISKNQKYVMGGNWTGDGKYFLYWAGTEWHQDIWVSREKPGWWPLGRQGPWRLTSGAPGSWRWPKPSSDGSIVFAVNTSFRPELIRFDTKTNSWQPQWGGAPAYELDYSRDLKWVAYTYFRDHTIWKARPDGSEHTRLTQPGIEVHQPHWSPDGTHIAFMGKNAQGQWRVYQVAARGGAAEELFSSGQDQGVPTWSPDGRFLLFGDLRGRGPTADMSLHLLNLSSRKLTDLPGSKGLWSPRWSPEGRYIAAITSDSKAIRIAAAQGGPWRELVKMKFVDNATWSPDSRYIYFDGRDNLNHSWLFRLAVPTGKLERLADLADFTYGSENWHGVGPGGVPLALRGVAMEEIYALQCVLP